MQGFSVLNNKILMFISNLDRLDKYWVGEYEELGGLWLLWIY